MSQIIKVQTKARKHYPSVDTEYTVVIERNQSIVILVDGVEVNRFNLGDEATYGSYNLIYTGTITKITDKLVQITAYPNSRNERRHNLDLNSFCWRNKSFSAEKAAEHNSNEMYYI
jgi:hypothetical protein